MKNREIPIKRFKPFFFKIHSTLNMQSNRFEKELVMVKSKPASFIRNCKVREINTSKTDSGAKWKTFQKLC